jgi:OHCU decarboxylase
VRELPRQLDVAELAELFSGRTELVERLAALEDPLGPRAEEVALGLPERAKAEALAAHPRIGERSPEQHGEEADVLAELASLNRAYEERFGFRFVVFVNRRSRAELVPVLSERLGHSREDELDEGMRELVAIGRDRWRRG